MDFATVSLTLALLVLLALAFDFMNGFHDAANSIATVVSTGVLKPWQAVLWAAFFNVLAWAVFHLSVAATVGKGIIDPAFVDNRLIFGALIGAIAWNLITWYYGLPSSSSHALIGGLVGAALAAGIDVAWSVVVDKVLIPMILSPLFAFSAGFLVMLAIMWIFRRTSPRKANRNFRLAQTISAAAMALGHGLQDAQKTMGVIFLALLTGGYVAAEDGLPLWVIFSAAAAISLGTYSGGWRIMRTLGRRIIHLDPPRGFAAESVAASVLYTTAYVYEAPISTTHTITSAVMGVGATKRLSAVRWGVAKSILTAWVLTFPAAGLAAAFCYGVAHFFIEVI
jgi:PiT family inorganic phosphate transporter